MKKFKRILLYGFSSIFLTFVCTSPRPLPQAKPGFQAKDKDPFSLVLELEKLYRTQNPKNIRALGSVNEEGLWSVVIYTDEPSSTINELEKTKKWNGPFFTVLAVKINKFFLKEEVVEFEGIAEKDSEGVWRIHINYMKKVQLE